MAKISFTKLKLSKNDSVNTFIFNEQEISVKQYLPINDKLNLIEKVINSSVDDNRFYNPVKLDIFLALEIIYNYTNISFTEKQKEDPIKLFDLFESSGLLTEIIKHIPEEEYKTLYDGIVEIVDSIYQYQNSIYGILDNISTDYNNLNLDVENLQQKIKDPDSLALLKDVLTKLG